MTYNHVPSRLSHSQLMLYRKDPREYFLKYICKAPKVPQTPAMCVGSAFDAFVKANLEGALKGWSAGEIADCLDSLFEAQVEPHNRDFAWDAGAYVYSQYCSVGADSRLLAKLSSATTVCFEGRVEVEIDTPHGPVPIIGYPDLFWLDGASLSILDWKVNGYCSKSGMSPGKGYTRIYNTEIYGPRGDGKRHALAADRRVGVWHDQIATYCLMLGHTQCAAQIDQIVCAPLVSGAGGQDADGTWALPKLRIAEHNGFVDIADTTGLAREYGELWHALHTGTVLSDAEEAELTACASHDIMNVIRARKQRF